MVTVFVECYYGPTAWDPDAGHLWHRACPDEIGAGHDGEVWFGKDGSTLCQGCGAFEDGDGA